MAKRNVWISTYTFIYNGTMTNNAGPVAPLLGYFSKRTDTLYFLEQPLPGSDDLSARLRIFKSGKCVSDIKKNFLVYMPKNRLPSNKTYLLLKFRDFLSNLYFIFKHYNALRKDPVDLFIGVESLNALCGIFFKKIGIVKKTVYYIFDWAPDRYKNRLMNAIYLWMDREATYKSDATWNITYAIADARRDILHYDAKKMSCQFYVPYCVNVVDGMILPETDIDLDLMIYSGGLIEENGPFLLLEAFNILRKKFPAAKLRIIGGNDLEKDIREYLKKNDLIRSVEITGFIPCEAEVIRLQQRGVIGIAPYPDMKNSRKPFGDVIKIRMYFATGLVVVSTPVPPVASEIRNERLGCVTKKSEAHELAESMFLLLSNKEELLNMRRRVVEKAKKSSWENNYSSTLLNMGLSYLK